MKKIYYFGPNQMTQLDNNYHNNYPHVWNAALALVLCGLTNNVHKDNGIIQYMNRE